MSTLTKVFIVLLSVFSIAFTVMTISVVAQTSNWKDTAEKFQSQAQIADTNLRNLIAANAAELAASRDAVKAGLDRIADVEKSLKSSQQEAGQLKIEQARAAAEKSNAEAINRGLLAQLQTADDARAELRKQRDELEQRNIELERRNIDLNDRVNEQTAQLAVFIEQKRQFEQQLHLLKAENERVGGEARRLTSGGRLEDPSGAGLPGLTAVTPVALRAIRGRLTAVDGDRVALSVGSADGVKKDMRFVIYRGEQYVGDVTIHLVEPNQSAGRLVRSVSTPQSGDEIVDEVGFVASRG